MKMFFTMSFTTVTHAPAQRMLQSVYAISPLQCVVIAEEAFRASAPTRVRARHAPCNVAAARATRARAHGSLFCARYERASRPCCDSVASASVPPRVRWRHAAGQKPMMICRALFVYEV